MNKGKGIKRTYYIIKVIIEIISNTFHLLLKDKKSLIILLLMPFILISILGFSLANVMDDSNDFDAAVIGIVDEDQTIASRLLVDNGFNNEEVKKIVSSYEYSKIEAEEKFLNEELDGILYIHKGYENNFIFGHQDSLILKMNPTKSIQGKIIKDILLQYHILGKMVVDSVNDGRALTNFPSVADFLNKRSIYLDTDRDNTSQKSLNSFQYYTVGMGVMYTLYTMLTGVTFTLTEKSQNTINRIKLMPFSLGVFYLGKSIAFMLISSLQLIILFLTTHLLYGVNFGSNLFLLFTVIIVYSFATSSMIILLSGLINNQGSLSVFFSIGVPIMAALGGSMIPLSSFPWFIEPFSMLLPNKWAMDGFFAVILNQPERVYPAITFLLSYSLLFIALGIMHMVRKGSTQ